MADVSPRQTHSSTPPVPPVHRSMYETTQHPHPPPQHSFSQSQNDKELQVILLPLAYVEDVPNGTPGGHRRDLARGVLRDDVRSANDGMSPSAIDRNLTDPSSRRSFLQQRHVC